MAEITVTRVSLTRDNSRGVLAYCTVLIGEEFAIHGVKVISSLKHQGRLIVAMPAWKKGFPCLVCGHSCQIGSWYCYYCGANLSSHPEREEEGYRHMDIIHPIDSKARVRLDSIVLKAYWDAVKVGNVVNGEAR
jgi:DNA-binding cell septation regulator SpoVG